MVDAEPRRERAKVRSALAALAILLGLGGAAAAGARVGTWLVARSAERALFALSQALGADAKTGSVDLVFSPLPAVRFGELAIAWPGDPAMVTAHEARARVAVGLWLRTLGRQVRVTELALDGVVLSAARRPDGSWNLLPLLGGLASGAAPASPRIDHVTIRRARLDVLDAPRGGAVVSVDSFEGDLTPLANGLGVRASGTFLSDRPNVTTDLVVTRAASARTNAGAGSAAEVRGSLALVHVDLARMKQLLPSPPKGTGVTGEVSVEMRVLADAKGGVKAQGTGSGTVLGGTLALADVRVALPVDAAVPTAWSVRATLDRGEVAELARVIGSESPVSGAVKAAFDLAGSGTTWEALAEGLSGQVVLDLTKGSLTGDAVASLSRPVRAAFASFGVPSTFLPAVGPVALEPVHASLHIAHKSATLDEAAVLRSSFADVVLAGSIGLDGKLALAGTATLHALPGLHAFAKQTRAGRLPIALRGTLEEPAFTVPGSPLQVAQSLLGFTPPGAAQ